MPVAGRACDYGPVSEHSNGIDVVPFFLKWFLYAVSNCSRSSSSMSE